MSVHRIMGIETEYGVAAPGNPAANPMIMSGQVVTAYALPMGELVSRARWDYEDEAPLQDARGFAMPRDEADPSQLTDLPGGEYAEEIEDPTMANVVLTNGARLYVDHAHPEYSSPEVSNPRDGALYDKAGEQVMLTAARRIADGLSASVPGAQPPPINLYKNNIDNKGASYGTHENYLMPRVTPFPRIIAGLIPFFVTRQVYTGSGRVGLGQQGDQPGFQLSQRADYMEAEVGLETTLKRPIVNTRDEPHADPEIFRRLHVIIGDANLNEVATYVKLGTTALVLDLIEAGQMPDLTLAAPVAAVRAISHDPSCSVTVQLADGRALTAIQIQWEILRAASDHVDRQGQDDMTRDVLSRWESLLNRLERDPMECAREVDWVTKLRLLEGTRSRYGVDWDDARLQAIDLQYSDVRPERGLYQRLVAKGAVDRLFTDDEIARAVGTPPSDTRAFFRGECIRRFGVAVCAASWDSVIFEVPGQSRLQRVPMLAPQRGTREHVGAILDSSSTAAELLDALQGRRKIT